VKKKKPPREKVLEQRKRLCNNRCPSEMSSIRCVLSAVMESRACVNGWKILMKSAKYACGQRRKKTFMRKRLRRSAKLFVTYEKCCGTWKKLERALSSEFDNTLNNRQIHKELARTKKKVDESYHNYVYKMIEIVSHSDIEMEAKIQYIIDGIQNDPVNKTILYGKY